MGSNTYCPTLRRERILKSYPQDHSKLVPEILNKVLTPKVETHIILLMYQTSVANLYIGKSGLKFKIDVQKINLLALNELPTISPTNLVMDLMLPYPKPNGMPYEPDYILRGCIYNGRSKTVIFDPCRTTGGTHEVVVTGIPIADDPIPYRKKEAVFEKTFYDNASNKKYLFQVIKIS
jgi:hypothetical protein